MAYANGVYGQRHVFLTEGDGVGELACTVHVSPETWLLDPDARSHVELLGE
jgi:hypothetical protein